MATPIGNLGDITLRAIETLKAADFVAAEDTRVSLKLFNHLGIKKSLVSYHEHNKEESGAKIVSRIAGGESCALVTDAGTPAISDPGEALVRLCAERGIEVVPIPGACAAISALAASGLSAGRFCFEGFLSTSKKSRAEHLEGLRNESRTMIFYEAPHKLRNTLRDLLDAFGDRDVSVSRELTKLHEETLRMKLSDVISHFEETQPKGEFVLIVSGAEPELDAGMSRDEALLKMKALRAEGHSLKEAARMLAKESGLSKNELYALGLAEE